jgi:hypothetical protein
MTSHPLDDARLKIVWADKHLETFKRVAGEYVKTKPNTIAIENTHESFQAMLREEAVPGPPDDLRCIAGDCVTNARAALDYIVWALASKYFSPVFDNANRNDRRITAFPLTRDPTDKGYADRLNCLSNRQIPAGAIDEIKRVQPFNARYAPLWNLHQIVNRDKHRLPALIAGRITAIGPMSISAISDDGKRVDTAVGIGIANGVDIDTSHLSGYFKVQVHTNAALYVTFSDPPMPSRQPADVTLEEIVECVAEVIQGFSRFF